VGSALGLWLAGPLARRHQESVIRAVGLAVAVIGVRMASGAQNLPLIIIGLAAGTIMGEEARLEHRLEEFGRILEARFSRGQGEFVRGFITATLVYCVGAMGIMGALEDGLTGSYTILLAKSALDGITAVVFASSMGPGVAFSAVPVFLYQGTITLLARTLEPLLTPGTITDMTATGGLLIVGIGLNLLGVTRLRLANLLPAVGVVAVLVRVAEALTTRF